MTSLQDAARQLTVHQPTLSYFEAHDILLDAYRRLRPASRYPGLLESCLKIEWSILLRSSEQELEQRLKAVSEKI